MPLEALIDHIIQPKVASHEPGYVVAVYRDQQMAFDKAYGLADLELNVPLSVDSRFDIASNSKQFTAACVVLLEQAGKLRLTDPITRFVPELPDFCQHVTLDHLLYHTSGLRDYIGVLFIQGFGFGHPVSDQQALAAICLQPQLDFAVGEKHEYSNTNYFLLSLVVERTSGQRLREYARQQLFEPLGMADTDFVDQADEVVPNRAQAYSYDGESGRYKRSVGNWCAIGDGGIYSTVADLLKWDTVFYSQEPKWQQLTKRLLERGKLNNGDSIVYARGLVHGDKGEILHGGGWGAYRTSFFRYAEHQLTVVILANHTKPNGIVEKLLEAVLADQTDAQTQPKPAIDSEAEKPQTVPFDSDVFHGACGLYALGDEQELFEVVPVGEQLMLKIAGHDLLLKQSISGELVFQSILRLELDADTHTIVRWHEREEKQMAVKCFTSYELDTLQVEQLCGRYYSTDVAAWFDVFSKEGRLWMRNQGYETFALLPLASDRLALKWDGLEQVRMEQTELEQVIWFKFGDQVEIPLRRPLT